ncbi:WG repeat-containing protein [Hymenobacter siberiensis]|uniref:WG repeat-containing protein n=1 Tax=Hymenobacter siberiensis TaxID=2848396 RepID=UPI001C1DD6F2|nr:WG repeat-containing protein [Hymenobacter siberiensis]MBU6121368.1 WG repeat-containing protein [Hymenobacter siberiensis]
MVHCFLASPFIDVVRAGQFAALQATLLASPGPDTLLLGNLVLADGTAPLDAVVVRPHSITVLVFAPRGGRLSIPALGYGRWQLNGVALSGPDDFDNPFEQFREQKAALAGWLQPRFTPGQADLNGVSGLVLFDALVEFGPDVEAALSEAPAGFRIATSPADVSVLLRDLGTPEINLTAADITEWAAEWAAFVAKPAAPESAGMASEPASATQAQDLAQMATSGSTFLGQKARALWGWLGANDVPDDDLPYGYTATLSARNEEKQQLEQLRQQMQADLSTQLQALEAREAERERSIAQLRTELAQAPPVAAKATALVSRLGAETREKAALEAEMQASRDELAARNQELDAKIQQLSQLIGQLNASPIASASAAAAPAAAVSPAPAAAVPVTAALPAAENVVESRNAPVAPAIAAAPSGISAAPVSVGAAPVAALPTATAVRPSLAEGQPAVSLANRLAHLRTQAHAAAEVLRPRLRQAWEWGQSQPRAMLAAAGVAVLGLGIWGLSHAGSAPPVPFQENGRWGYADASGQPVIPAQFTAASPFEKGQAVVAKDGAYGFVDEKGKEIIPAAYDALNPYVGGYARARVGDAYTFIDEDGQEFDHYYFNALDFAEGRAAVLDHRGWHYISGPTEPDTPPIALKEAYSFAEGLARVKLPDGYTFITADYLADPGQGTKPFGRYQQATDFANGQARVKQAGRSFTINKDGEEIK